MKRSVTPSEYRRVTLVAMVLLCIIVVTGALVRLSDSGLGCDDWPTCNDRHIVDVGTAHSAIEQLNRLFTGLVVAAVIVCVLAALVRSPRRRDLTWLSVSLVIGVLGQAVIGGIVVKTHLNPVAVQQHFLLSMVIVAAALVLHQRAGRPDDASGGHSVGRRSTAMMWAIGTGTAAAIVTGTIVTGTGPHSGSVNGTPVRRFGLHVTDVARLHSAAVLITVAIGLALMWSVRSSADRLAVERALTPWIGLAFLQGLVGYVQYFSGIPVFLVAFHVTLATCLWLSAVNLVLATRQSNWVASKLPSSSSSSSSVMTA
jgi:heme a synthase